jgi:hypothetical protein
MLKFPLRPLATALLLSAGVCAIDAWADEAWRARQAVEEAWIRDRHEILLQEAPAAMNAAQIYLSIQLEELKGRTLQANASEGWQRENERCRERVRQLTHSLQRHPQYSQLQRALLRLWKTPQYREAYRRYNGRLQDIRCLYDEEHGDR